MADTDDLISDDFDSPTPIQEQRHKEQLQNAEAELRKRVTSYSRVFVEGSATPDDVQIVMQDLGFFCCAYKSTFHEDARISAMLDGRREVFLRIMDFTKLDMMTLLVKYNQGHR